MRSETGSQGSPILRKELRKHLAGDVREDQHQREQSAPPQPAIVEHDAAPSDTKLL